MAETRERHGTVNAAAERVHSHGDAHRAGAVLGPQHVVLAGHVDLEGRHGERQIQKRGGTQNGTARDSRIKKRSRF